MRRLSSRSALILGLLVASLLLTGCEEMITTDPEVDRADVEATLRAYLPLVGQAYSTGNLEALRENAVEKEVQRIRARIFELEEQGLIYAPEFKDLTVEAFSTWRSVNAVVTTLEVWDVSSRTMGDPGQVISEAKDQRNRVKYQLRRQEDGKWQVMYRELAETLD